MMQALFHLGHGPPVAYAWPNKNPLQNLCLVIECVCDLRTIGPDYFPSSGSGTYSIKSESLQFKKRQS